MRIASRYHPALVAIHWIVGLLIIADLAIGTNVLVNIPNTDPRKLEGLRAHMLGGLAILFLMTLRLGVRLNTAQPDEATTGSLILDRIAWASHRLLYVAVFGMALSGLTLAIQARVPQAAFLHEGALPASFWTFPLRWVHFVFAKALMGLIALHIAGAGYHALVRRDGLLARMWFGVRAMAPAGEAATRPAAPLTVRAAPWFSRLVLGAATVLFVAIGLKFVLDPAGAAAQSGIVLSDPLGFTDTRAGSGGFPLAIAVGIAFCLTTGRRLTGLAAIAIVIATVLAARLLGVALDGTLARSAKLIAPEVVLLTLSLAATTLELRVRSPQPSLGLIPQLRSLAQPD
jgi:cytochrome b561